MNYKRKQELKNLLNKVDGIELRIKELEKSLKAFEQRYVLDDTCFKFDKETKQINIYSRERFNATIDVDLTVFVTLLSIIEGSINFNIKELKQKLELL